jgi:hypothetical protein
MQYPHLRPIAAVCLSAILAGCGGGGGSSTALNDTPNPSVAAQVADITPDNADDTVSVFVALDTNGAASAVSSLFRSPDAQRIEDQQNFLASLKANAHGALQAANGGTCSTTDLATRINQAHTPNSGNVVRIDLNACELDILPQLKGVAAVHADIPMSTQGSIVSSITTDTVRLTNDSVNTSFNGATSQLAINSRAPDGAGQVIALMDSGVEARHPALGSSKVLSGACFSTATNGGRSFCPNGLGTDTTSSTAGASCAERWSGSRTEAITAGCGHGTAMAAAASMNYSVGGVTAKGIAPNAQVLPVQVFNQTTTTTGKTISASGGDLLAAIEWVTLQAQQRRQNGQSPIVAMNMSLGGGSYTTACDSDYVGSLFKTAFTNLRAQGVLPIVATGNGGTKNAISFPACVSNTVSVSAAKLGYSDVASYANFNNQTKLLAIGGDIDGSGRYFMPMLCPNAGSYDCWQEVAGTSPATALASGGVAVLYSVKPDATLANVESALTTDIAALNLTNSTAMHLTVNDGAQNITRPALRLTASANRLVGNTESTPTSSNTNNNNSSNNNTVIAQAQICIFGKPNYLGGKACTTQAYGPNASAEYKDVFYRFSGKVGSISITDVQTRANLATYTASVTIYTALSASSQSGTVNASSTDTTRLTIFNNPTIRMIRVHTQ